MSKNSSVAITFILQLHFSSKTEKNTKIAKEFLMAKVSDVSLSLKMLKLDMQPNFTLFP